MKLENSRNSSELPRLHTLSLQQHNSNWIKKQRTARQNMILFIRILNRLEVVMPRISLNIKCDLRIRDIIVKN